MRAAEPTVACLGNRKKKPFSYLKKKKKTYHMPSHEQMLLSILMATIEYTEDSNSVIL